jgi:superfamily II DNA or RNA helicase
MPTPWQREAAEKVAALLSTDEKEYVVLNMPPGSGKTTMLHDVAAWMTVRDRTDSRADGCGDVP